MASFPPSLSQLSQTHSFSPGRFFLQVPAPSTSLAADLSYLDKHPTQPLGLWLCLAPSFMWLGPILWSWQNGGFWAGNGGWVQSANHKRRFGGQAVFKDRRESSKKVLSLKGGRDLGHHSGGDNK